MKTYIQPGRQLSVAAPYTVTAGQGVLIDRLFGVALGDAANGAAVDILTEGVVALAKPTGAIFTVGAPVYFDVATKTVRSGETEDSNSAGESEAVVGVVVEAAGAGVLTVKVKLAPSPVTLV